MLMTFFVFPFVLIYLHVPPTVQHDDADEAGGWDMGYGDGNDRDVLGFMRLVERGAELKPN